MTHCALTLRSRNSKTGPIPVSTSEETTCPATCPFRAKGCYAKSGFYTDLHWHKVTTHKRGVLWAAFCASIAALPDGTIWRHNIAGDLPGYRGRINTRELDMLVKANDGRRGFTYSHKRTPQALAAIAKANANGFTINLSANNAAGADTLAATNAGPVVCVMPQDFKGKTTTPQGRTIIQCPATFRDGITCATCQLCQRQRSTIVGFPAHGSTSAAATTIAKG